ncbi:MAG: hypothetical protein WC480_02755 [Patescibacteria group bacterium]
MINLSHRLSKDSFYLLNNPDSQKKYLIKYPEKIFNNLADETKKAWADNLLYCRTCSLSLVTTKPLYHNIPEPQLAKLIHYGLIKDLPRISFETGIKTKKLLAQFWANQKNKKIVFTIKGKGQAALPNKKNLANKAIIAMSFGKDSVLSYGLAKELGLDCQLVFINELEEHNSPELKFKMKIIKEFEAKERKKVNLMINNIDGIFYTKKIKNNIGELENTNANLSFTLEMLPFAYYYQAKYIIIGNECNFKDYFINDEGFKTYPAYDQSADYNKIENQHLGRFTNNNLQVMSLVEPIYNLAEMQILYHRYPQLLQYVMSCYPKPYDPDRWCYACPMCAKAWLYSVAVGGDPKKIGFNKNLFSKEYQKLYPLFATKVTRLYEKPAAVREEQLLSFLLAYQVGWRGDLINLFKDKYLDQAKKREQELRRKFFSIYPMKTIPNNLKSKLTNIFKQELTALQ